MINILHRTMVKSGSNSTTTDEQTVFEDSSVLSWAVLQAIAEQKVEGQTALVLINAAKAFPLVTGVNVLGRDKTCRIKLDDPVVSRQHAQVVVTGRRIVLTDLLSTNGTYVNGRRVIENTVLSAGDRVRMGLLEFVVAA